MPVSLNSTLIAGAVPAQPQISAIPLNICTPPPEGFRMVPMQFTGIHQHPILVDLSSGVNTPISQLAAMYVDATGQQFDVTIVFPDSGFSYTVQAGNTSLFPVLAGKGLPKFIICFPSGGASTDILNIFCLNQFIPAFSDALFQKATLFGTSWDNTNSEVSLPAESVGVFTLVTLTTAFQSIGFFNFTSSVITGLEIYIDAQTTAGSLFRVITLAMDTNVIMKIPVIFTATEQVIPLIGQKMPNVRPFASQHTQLQIKIDNVTNLSIMDAYCNVQQAKNNHPT